MEFWGVEIKPKKSFKLKRTDYGGTRLHISQATLGSKISSGRSIVRCRVGDGPVVFLCSLLPGVLETCSLDLFFEDDIVLSVKGNTSVHLVGYFEPFEDEHYPGDDCESDGYSEEEDEVSEDDSLNEFIVEDGDSDSEGEDVDYEDDALSTSDEDELIMVPNKGVSIEEMSEDDGMKVSKDGSEDKCLVPVKSGNKKSKRSAVTKKESSAVETKNNENDVDLSKPEPNGVNQSLEENGVDKSKKAADDYSEDEDGFPVNNKRKLKEVDGELPVNKKRSTDARDSTPEPATGTTDSELTPMKTDTPSESAKKKKKKNKNKKKDNSPSKENTVTPSKENNAQDQNNSAKESDTGVENSSKKGTVRKFPNGLEVENVSMGKPDGKQAKSGKKVGMIYIGRLKSNGKIFDSNVGKKPFFFRLGVGEVIKGWDVGVNGMRVGDKRKLTIPPEMGYGRKGVPGIPPNSSLVFDVELIEVK